MLLSSALATGTVAMCAPLKEINDIRTSRSLKNKSVFNFLLLWFNYAMWSFYSAIQQSFDVVCMMYFMGLVASCGYCFYYILHVGSITTLKKIAYLYASNIAFVVLIVLYAQSGMHSIQYTNHIVGLLACTATICLAIFPLVMTPVIVETGSSPVSLPIYMANSANSLLWFAYGYSIHDPYTAISNLFAFVLSSMGLVILLSSGTLAVTDKY